MSREPSATAARHRAFLKHLAATGSPQEAARLSGLTLKAAEDMYIADDNFSDAWDLAEDEADAAIENEVRRRALEVTEQPLLHRGRPVHAKDGTPITVRRYNNRMMMLLLRYIDER